MAAKNKKRLEERRGHCALSAGRCRRASPRPFGYFNDVLVMEMVTDAQGEPAPRLGEVELSPEQAREFHGFSFSKSFACCALG